MNASIDRVRDEMAKNPKDGMLDAIGGFLTALAAAKPETLEKLADEKKSIKGAIEAMRTEAAKHKTGNYAALDFMTGIKIVLSYYGIEITQAEILHAAMAMSGAEPERKEAEASADEFDLDALLEG